MDNKLKNLIKEREKLYKNIETLEYKKAKISSKIKDMQNKKALEFLSNIKPNTYYFATLSRHNPNRIICIKKISKSKITYIKYSYEDKKINFNAYEYRNCNALETANWLISDNYREISKTDAINYLSKAIDIAHTT